MATLEFGGRSWVIATEVTEKQRQGEPFTCLMSIEGSSAREKHGLGHQMRYEVKDICVKMLSIMDVYLDVGTEAEALRITVTPLNVSASEVMSDLHLCHLAPGTTLWSKEGWVLLALFYGLKKNLFVSIVIIVIRFYVNL